MMEDILQFDLPKFESSYIKVIGVGGGGSNAVNHMCTNGIKGVDFVICNTDRKSLDTSIVSKKIQLGTDGLGAGNLPDVARRAAEGKAEEIKTLLSDGTKMLFITAGMGGGTGTGAAPVIARLAKEIDLTGDDGGIQKILTVAIVTRPFSFEGRKRLQQAEAGILELKKHVDAVLVINNDRLRDLGDLSMEDAFAKANEVLLTAAKGIAEIITVSAYVAIDFNDVNTVMANSGVALMGSGMAIGENRSMAAIEAAVSSPLLDDNDISGAKDILLYLSYNGAKGVTMDEVTEVTDYITHVAGNDVDVIWGYGKDESLEEGQLKVTLIATGFDKKDKRPKVEDEIKIEPVVIPEPVFENPAPVEIAPYIVNTKEEEKREEEPVQAPRIIHTLDFEDSTSKKVEQKEEVVEKVFSTSLSDNFGDPTLVSKKVETQAIVNNTDNLFSPAPVANNTVFEPVKQQQAFNMPKTDEPVFKTSEEQRAERLRNLSLSIKTAEGLQAIESTPAYLRRNQPLDAVNPSNEPESSSFKINEKEGTSFIKKDNSFLHGNVD